MHNFTVSDLAQTTLATLAFALFLLPPGYLLGLASNAFGMRRRSASEKLLFSIAFSFAATPILSVLLARWFSFQIALAVFLLLVALSAATLIRQLPAPGHFLSSIQRSTWLLLCMALVWFLAVQFSLADLQIGNRLYVNYVAYDHSVRVPFVEAAARNGVPPLNPFYGLGKVPVLRYYYYWYVVCALPMRLFGLSAKACLDASVFWSGAGLAAIIPLFLKHFLHETENLRRKSVIGIALLTVTGLDLIPYAAMVHKFHVFPADMEWWDSNQVTSWAGSLLWVPHHVASLAACMVGLLILAAADEESSPGQTVWAAAISGLAFASAAGLSVYVTFTFAVFAIVWALWVLFRKNFRTFAAYLAAGGFSLLLSWPYLLDLLSKHGQASGTGERFAFFAVRDSSVALEFFGQLGLRSPLLLEISKLPVLLITYFLEFGFFFLAAVLCLRQDLRKPAPLSRERRMAWLLFAVCLLIMSILKSDSTGANDLGFRGMLVVQFVLLIWSAPLVHDCFFPTAAAGKSYPPWVKASLLLTLLLGAAGTACQLAALRCYAPLADAGKLVRSENFLGAPGFGERTYWMRQGFSRLGGLTSSAAFVQYNPANDEILMAHLYSPRQAVVGDSNCASAAFGGDSATCQQALPYFAAAFNTPGTVRNWNLDEFCDAFRINLLVATDADPVWQDPSSWVWMRPSLLANPGLRAIPCGTVSPSLAAR